MAEFGAAGAGRRDEDRRARKEGTKLLKKVVGAAGMGGLLTGGRSKEKLRREKQRRRAAEEQARAETEARVAVESRGRIDAQRDAQRYRATAAAAARATEALEADGAAARARAHQEVEAERRRHQREMDEAREVAQSYTRDVEAELEDARAVVARTQEFYETERGEREAAQRQKAEAERRRQASEEAAQRRERDLREQIRTMERELEEHEGGGFGDVCGLFSGVSGGVAARARGAALREAKQELDRRRAELAVVVAQSADRERHVDAAQAEAAARTAAADAALRERDDATARLATESARNDAVRRQVERERARAFTASVEMHQTRDRLINSKNHELRQQAERSNAYMEEATRARDQKHALHERSRRAEARLRDTEAELRRVKEAAALGDAAQRSSAEETQRLQVQVAAWRNVAAAKEELDHATAVCRRGDGDQHNIKRMHDASRTYDAARAAAEASTQQDDRAAAASEEPLPVGTAVQLVGCAFNTSFNGRRGIVAEAPQDLIDRGQVAVNLDAYGGGGTLPFRRKNVVKWSPEQAAGGPAFAFGASSPAPPAPAPARGPAFTFGAAPPPAAPAAPVGDEGELAADLDKLDRAVSSLLASKNELKREVRSTCRRLPINNNGHSIAYAMKAVEKDFENMSKMIQEFRSRAEAQRPSAAASEEPLPVGTAVQLVGCAFNTSFNGRRGIIAEAPQDLIDRGRVAVKLGGVHTLPFSRKNVVKWSPEQAAGGPAFAFGASSPAPPAPARPAFTFGAAPPAAAPPAPPAPPPAPRAPQPAVVQQTTYYSSSPSPQTYVPRPAPAPPRRSSSGGARMGTVLRNDGLPDRRYASPRPVTTSGRPDRRFSVNRPATSSTRSSGSSSGRRSGGTRRK